LPAVISKLVYGGVLKNGGWFTEIVVIAGAGVTTRLIRTDFMRGVTVPVVAVSVAVSRME
jgi:hypothetical protein